MSDIRLDPFNETKKLSGYRLIDTEIAFLEYALSNEPLYIKGMHLCEWAETFYKGRQIDFQFERSIVRELLKTYSHLSEEDALKIKIKLEENANTDIRLSPKEILNGCFPNKLWYENSSIVHAADWLLWIVEVNPEPLFEPFITQLCSVWKNESPDLTNVYECFHIDEAEKIIRDWVCYLNLDFIACHGGFPKELPTKWKTIKSVFFETEIIESKGNYFLSFLEHESIHADKLLVSSKTIEYFEYNPQNITLDIYKKLFKFATGKDLQKLLKLKPLTEPGPLPAMTDEIFRWFEKEYLPYRQRAIIVNDKESEIISVNKAKEFSYWYLDYYPKAIIQGKNLSPHKAYEIKEKNKDHITLFVILDGLNAIDSKLLINELLTSTHSTGLNLVDNSYIFSLLPTVTEFTKKFLVNGTISINSEKFDKLGVDIPDKSSPAENLTKAKAGEIIIWRIQEPDNTYHKESQSKDLLTKIQGQLMIISNRIWGVIEETPPYIPLRIIITTDHGRLIGKSKREVKVPEGMVAHGRAAWGQTNLAFNSNGYNIQDDIVFLSNDTFYLNDQTAAIILSDEAFIHDVFSEEISPHGGLFPEEVIIPWFVVERNSEKPTFSFKLTGSGQANKARKASLKIINTSTYNAVLVSAELNLGTHSEKINLEKFILPKSENQYELDIEKWPSTDQTQTGSLMIEIDLPNGDRLVNTLSLQDLKSESMYSRDNILEDLF